MTNNYEYFNTATVRFVPAECSRGCQDPECPYTHTPAWFALLDPRRLFNSKQEAIDYARSLGDMET